MLDNAISLMLIWICTTELKHILGIELTDVLCSHTELSSWYEMVETFIQIECKPPSPESHFSSQRNHPYGSILFPQSGSWVLRQLNIFQNI